MTTLDMATAQLRSTKEPPGKRRANNFLTRYRELMPNVKGECIDVTDDGIGFGQWAVYLAHHPQAREIFRKPITAFHAGVFDEKDPNRGKMERAPLRVDFVCTRADRSAVRLHPGQIKEANFVEGILEDWRKGTAAIHAPVLTLSLRGAKMAPQRMNHCLRRHLLGYQSISRSRGHPEDHGFRHHRQDHLLGTTTVNRNRCRCKRRCPKMTPSDFLARQIVILIMARLMGPIIWSLGLLDIWTFGLWDPWTWHLLLDFWTLGLVGFWTFRLLDLWTLGLFDFGTF